MTATVKRIVAFALVLMLVFSLSVPAFAATKPTATHNYATNQYVRRGYRYTLTFRLRSGSYTLQRGYYRARFDTDMFRNSNGRLVAYTNYYYFSGTRNLIVRYTFSSRTYARYTWYRLRYRTQYRSTYNSRYWYTSTSRYIYFYVR